MLLSVDHIRKTNVRGACSTHGRTEKKHLNLWSKNMKERNHTEDLDASK